MRKRNVSYLADTIFWYLLYFLPVIAFGIMLAVGQVTTFDSALSTLGLTIDESSIAYTTLSSIIGAGGILPMFASPGIIKFFVWFINVLIAHLLVDFILFIPRIAHKWMSYFYQDKE